MFHDAMVNMAIDAALEAGKAILDIYHNGDFGVEMKSDNSPLTLADKAAHEVIVRILKPSGLPVLSEEGRSIPYAERSRWNRFWMVDPLDGTKEFISRNGEFTVNIALIEDGVPVMGVVYVPVLDELYVGAGGNGAFLLQQASIQASTGEHNRQILPKKYVRSPGDPYRVVGSRSHLNEETLAFVEELRREHPAIEMVQRGSSLKICMVASGDADCYPRFGPTMEWDTAAGHAVVRAAGKRVVEAGSEEELRYNKSDLLNPFFIVW